MTTVPGTLKMLPLNYHKGTVPNAGIRAFWPQSALYGNHRLTNMFAIAFKLLGLNGFS
jgi:hypothetical protein